MVVAKQVKEVVSPGELAIRIEKRWITRDSLIQQLGPLEQISFIVAAKGRVQKKILGARVQIERGDIACRGTFDCVFLSWRKFCPQLFRNRLCDLALNGEYVGGIAIISLPP